MLSQRDREGARTRLLIEHDGSASHCDAGPCSLVSRCSSPMSDWSPQESLSPPNKLLPPQGDPGTEERPVREGLPIEAP